MNTQEIIKYLQDNPSDMVDVMNAMHFYFDKSDKENIKGTLDRLKQVAKHFRDKLDSDKTSENRDMLYKIEDKVRFYEKLYQIFEPEFSAEHDNLFRSQRLNDETLREIFSFRKEMFRTQDIDEDYILDKTINEDMSSIWSEVGGQDGMYKNMPFAKSYMDKTREWDYTTPENCRHPQSNRIHFHYTEEMLRCYALSSAGGIAIIETKVTEECLDDNTSHSTNRYQIVTLGEDDGFHFLNSARIYETISWYINSEKFVELLIMCVDEYKKVRK